MQWDEILEVLSATKTAVTNSYSQNDNMTYIISIVNSGTVPFSGISVTDNLGAYLSGTESLTPLTYNDGSIKYYMKWSIAAFTGSSGRSANGCFRNKYTGRWECISSI